ncbi:MAG: alpha/beta hydrolase [Blastocatellia bacterium]|nr:alpha/beta hydrolase [Blastocatellia bacterium]
MTTNISRRIFITLFVIAISTFAAFAQTKESPSPDRFARLDALRVHYRTYGDGKNAVVFIHGWTCNLNFWKANIPTFTNRLRVIAIDLPGHGESDKPEITYTMDLFARAIDAVLTDAGVERATLVGHSMGTPVIRQFYRKYPNKTLALVIVDGSLRPFGNNEGMKQFLDQLRASNYKEQAAQIVGFMVQPVKDKKNQEEIKAAMLSAPQHVMVGAWEAMLDESIWKQDKINVPTLALMAKRTQWNDEYEKFVRELVPGVDYQVWEGVSHFLMMDDPQKFNDTVLAFLEKNKLIK